MAIEEITPVSISIELDVVERIVKILIEQRDNCNELLMLHDSSLGRTTHKNICIAEMYEAELIDIDNTVTFLEARLFD